MTVAAPASLTLKFLEDRWDPVVADKLDEPELLRYRSNLLGSDLRITNFAGGNTSSKIEEPDPLTGKPVQVLWVKGSGGDLGSIKRTGFATLYQEKLLALEHSIKARRLKTTWSRCIPCAPSAAIRWLHPLIRRCMDFCPFRMSITFTRTGALRWRHPPTAKRRCTNSIAPLVTR